MMGHSNTTMEATHMGTQSISASTALDVLHDLAIQMRDGPGKPNLAQDIVETLEAGMGYELLAVLVKTEPSERLQPLALSRQGRNAAFVEADKVYVKSRCADVAIGLTNWVARTGDSVRVGNVADDRRYFGIREEIKSELCVPLKVGMETIGVLNTETTAPNAYSASDERFLQTAASHIALALQYNLENDTTRARPKGHSGRRHITTACMYCLLMKNRDGSWVPPADHLRDEFEILTSHGICPDCYKRLKRRPSR